MQSNVVPIRPERPEPQGPWGHLHGLEGKIKIAEHNGLQVLIFTDTDGQVHIIGEARHG